MNDAQTDNAKEIDILMSMYSLIEYRDNYYIWKFMAIPQRSVIFR